MTDPKYYPRPGSVQAKAERQNDPDPEYYPRPGSVQQHQADAKEAPLESEEHWDLKANRQQLRKLLKDEWPYWGVEHREQFADTLLTTVAELYSTAQIVGASGKATGQPKGSPPA
jgi:hypothetical protein